MRSINETTARQIWQRVSAPVEECQDTAGLLSLTAAAEETAACYKQLLSAFAGKSQLLRRLSDSQQETVFTLRGLVQLSGGRRPVRGQTPSPQHPRQLLPACYHRARNTAAEYTARTISPAYGPVFRILAQREEEHCAILAALLGQLGV